MSDGIWGPERPLVYSSHMLPKTEQWMESATLLTELLSEHGFDVQPTIMSAYIIDALSVNYTGEQEPCDVHTLVLRVDSYGCFRVEFSSELGDGSPYIIAEATRIGDIDRLLRYLKWLKEAMP